MTYGLNIFALEIENTIIKDFNKEILSKNHLRFENQKMVIHIQQEIQPAASKNLGWAKETLETDVNEMFKVRTKMYESMGIKNVKFDSYSLSKFQKKYDQLKIQGHYTDANDKIKWFSEDNIYIDNTLLQIKILNNKGAVSHKYLNRILTDLKISEQVVK